MGSVVIWMSMATAMIVAKELLARKSIKDTEEDGDALASPLTRVGSSEEIFEGTSKDKNAWTSRVPLAPQWASLYSLAIYLYLWGSGIAHLYREVAGIPTRDDRLYGDVTLLISAYTLESVYALVF